MPVNWQDGVTWVNAANLEIMEADTAAKQAQSEKAQANGYAPLDATAKVPLVHLPPVSGVDYIGTWGSGIAYKRGDVVRYGSNDYLAVNDSTGVTPPAAYAPPLGGVPLVTSLPASPYDGQEVVLVDSLTNPEFQWRFRYMAGSVSAYKWYFVGGAPVVRVDGPAYSPAAAGAWQASFGPTSFSVPRAGAYVFQIECTTFGPESNNEISVCNSTLGADPIIMIGTLTVIPNEYRQISVLGVGALGAGQTASLVHRVSALGSAFSDRTLSILPAQVL